MLNMKLRKFISFIIKMVGYVFLFSSAGIIIGSAETLDNKQFCINMLISIVLFILALVVYVLRDSFNNKYIKPFQR
jgi:uncharacterized membrane protein YkvI